MKIDVTYDFTSDSPGYWDHFWEKRIQFKRLGLNVTFYRKLKGMTQSELAKAVDLSRTHISNLEAPNVPTSISLEKLFDIADVLDVPVMKFFDFRE